MTAPVIKVECLSKKYLLRHEQAQRYTALRDVVARRASALGRMLRGPLTGAARGGAVPAREEFWALRDVSFEVRQGERLGIIGRNGAGKSTLLKLLARITEPTTGRIEIEGRVASLLEVGTGFHPELTGRENIFLNGAILGMGRAEIRRKFDEIVAFAEVEKFLDTPVKRYSSGMHVRLAFAVAAHLEPEILVVDEVLAVGDAEFQRKCLGRMEAVGREGRTVLFVSHNMSAVRQLCGRAILLEEGRLGFDAPAASAVGRYVAAGSSRAGAGELDCSAGDPFTYQSDALRFVRLRLLGERDDEVRAEFSADEPIRVEILCRVTRPLRGSRFNLALSTLDGELVFLATDHRSRPECIPPGLHRSVGTIPGGLLNLRAYVIAIGCDIPGVEVVAPRRECLRFSVTGAGNQGSVYAEPWPGVICPAIDWRFQPLAPVGVLSTGPAP